MLCPQEFQYPAHLIPGVQVYFVDGWRTTTQTLRALKDNGYLVVCYFRWVVQGSPMWGVTHGHANLQVP